MEYRGKTIHVNCFDYAAYNPEITRNFIVIVKSPLYIRFCRIVESHDGDRKFHRSLYHSAARNGTTEIIDLVRIIRVIGLCGEGDLAQERSAELTCVG